MVSEIRWTEDLATGVAQIDEQHKELFARAEKVMAACREGQPKTEVSPLFESLKGYVVTNFNNEERLQQQYGYPELQRHRAAHRRFVAEFTELRRILETEGPTLPFMFEVKRAVASWLANHIGAADRDVARFLKERGIPAS